MSCKHLTTGFTTIPGGSEIGGSLLPQRVPVPACRLGRKPNTTGWATVCDKTPLEGPCWFWIEVHRDEPDLKF